MILGLDIEAAIVAVDSWQHVVMDSQELFIPATAIQPLCRAHSIETNQSTAISHPQHSAVSYSKEEPKQLFNVRFPISALGPQLSKLFGRSD